MALKIYYLVEHASGTWFHNNSKERKNNEKKNMAKRYFPLGVMRS